MNDPFTIASKSFSSRLLLGTGKFASGEIFQKSLEAAQPAMVTVAIRRIHLDGERDSIIDNIDRSKYNILPNTAGIRTAKEAIFVAQMAREALQTNWIKVEIHPDSKYLMPDPIETLKATEELVKLGFIVLPYTHADPVLCKRLEEAGAATVMPLGAPIGSNQGLQTRDFLKIIIEQSNVPVVVDAGIGAPSHAIEAMELGADAVLLNTAIATAKAPIKMAEAFRKAVEIGRLAHSAQLPSPYAQAQNTSPLTSFLINA